MTLDTALAYIDTDTDHSALLGNKFDEGDVARLEGEFLQHQQAACPVTHRFGPGIYIREMTVKAGAYLIGHKHIDQHFNVLVSGKVMLFKATGETLELTAPFTFVGEPGRKLAYVIEDMVWQNIYATTETDVEKLEAILFEKSEAWEAGQTLLTYRNDDDVADFHDAIALYGFDAEMVAAISENTSDLIPFPFGEYKVVVAPSPIAGRGLFASGNIAALEAIAPARLDGKRTPAGRYTNHAKEPNAIAVKAANDDVYLFATRDISGSTGSALGEEITVDYRQILHLSLGER
jgi:hypothetical protein